MQSRMQVHFMGSPSFDLTGLNHGYYVYQRVWNYMECHLNGAAIHTCQISKEVKKNGIKTLSVDKSMEWINAYQTLGYCQKKASALKWDVTTDPLNVPVEHFPNSFLVIIHQFLNIRKFVTGLCRKGYSNRLSPSIWSWTEMRGGSFDNRLR